MALRPIKFSELDPTVELDGTERLPGVKGEDNVLITTQQIAALAELSGGSDKNYEQEFSDASLLEITHGLNKRPAITVIDSAGDEVEGDYSYPSLNVVNISFSAPFSGKVILN